MLTIFQRMRGREVALPMETVGTQVNGINDRMVQNEGATNREFNDIQERLSKHEEMVRQLTLESLVNVQVDEMRKQMEKQQAEINDLKKTIVSLREEENRLREAVSECKARVDKFLGTDSN